MAHHLRKTMCRNPLSQNRQTMPLEVRTSIRRWYNHLNPDIDNSIWTEEDEDRLFQAHKQYGNKWKVISQLFVGR
jgi:hypothetical protein